MEILVEGKQRLREIGGFIKKRDGITIYSKYKLLVICKPYTVMDYMLMLKQYDMFVT